jgi:fluoride exporter
LDGDHPSSEHVEDDAPDPRLPPSASGPRAPSTREPVPIDPDLAPSDPAEPGTAHRPAPRPRPSRARPDALAVIAAGGALGAAARYEMTRLIAVSPRGFPWATFWTNMSGSLVVGFVLVLIIERLPPSQHLRPFVVVGFLGAYTTYSTYMVETVLLVRNGHRVVAATYVLGSALVGFAAVRAGITAARRLAPSSRARGR